MKDLRAGSLAALLLLASGYSDAADQSGHLSRCSQVGTNPGMLPDPTELSASDAQCLTHVWLCGSLDWSGKTTENGDIVLVNNTISASTTVWLGSEASRCGPPATATSVSVSGSTKGGSGMSQASVNVTRAAASSASASNTTTGFGSKKLGTGPTPACGASSVHSVTYGAVVGVSSSKTMSLNDPC